MIKSVFIMKQTLLDAINVFLLKKGFLIKNLRRTCFDILAKKKDQILLIKVLEDANSINRQFAEEMMTIASYADASPLIVAEKVGHDLEDNIVYLRFGVYTLNCNTFFNCINNKFPVIKRSQAGLTVSVIGERLKQKREGFGYSLNAISKKIGVTSRMVMKYEESKSEVTINKAIKIYDLFGGYVFEEVNVFMQQKLPQTKFETEVSRKYAELGFDVTETKKTPFDIISKKEDELIFTEVSDNVNPEMKSLSKLLNADNLVIFQKKKPKDMPSLTKEEFMNFGEANELVKFIKDF